jgi:hypothetical protein
MEIGPRLRVHASDGTGELVRKHALASVDEVLAAAEDERGKKPGIGGAEGSHGLVRRIHRNLIRATEPPSLR